jgi:hypothetical protein
MSSHAINLRRDVRVTPNFHVYDVRCRKLLLAAGEHLRHVGLFQLEEFAPAA